MKETTSIYSPHVLIVEGIFALYDKRVLDLLDMKVRTLCHLALIDWDLTDRCHRSFAKPMQTPVCHEGY